MTETAKVHDNAERSRYELKAEGVLSFAAYERRGDAIAFTHTEVPKALEGKGFGSRLIEGALADVRTKGLKVIPLCKFVAAYMERHPEVQDLRSTGAAN